jgi:hypothetical protein
MIDLARAVGGPATLQHRAAAWHRQAAPTSCAVLVALKGCEEVGEVARAFHGRGSVADEAADVVLAMMVLVGRWYPERDLLAMVEEKLDRMIAEGSLYALGDGAPRGTEHHSVDILDGSEVGSVGVDGQEGSANDQHVDNITRPDGQLPETRSGDKTGTLVQRHPVDPGPPDLTGPDVAEPFDLLHPSGIAGAKVTSAGVVRSDGKPWGCTCGVETRTVGQMRQHRLAVGLRRDDHRLVPAPSEPRPQPPGCHESLDVRARRTVEQAICPLCDLAHKVSGPDGLADHLAVDHKLGGRAVCACGKDYRTAGYQRTHVSGIRSARGDDAGSHHLVVLACDHQPAPRPRPPTPTRPARAVTAPPPARQTPAPQPVVADPRPRPPSAWVPSLPARTVTAEERDRLIERRRRRAFEDVE